MQELQRSRDVIGGGEGAATTAFAGGLGAFRRGPIAWLILSGVLLIVMIVVGTVVMVDSFRDRALDNSKSELENRVLLLAHHFEQQLLEAEVVQKDIIAYLRAAGITSPDEYRRRMSGESTHLLLKSKISAMSYVGALSLVDSDGKLISTSRAWPTPSVSLANRSYFMELKANPKLAGILSEPLFSRVTDAWTITLSRRLNGPNGEFLGVVSRGIEPVHFEDFFNSMALGDHATLTMYHLDGTVLAGIPTLNRTVGANVGKSPLFEQILSKTNHGTIQLIDDKGEEQLASVRKLASFPIAIAATTSVAFELADWREQTRFLILVALLFAVVIVAMLFLIVRQLSRQHRWSEQRLTLEKQRLDTAINNMSQGLLLYDADEQIVVCNRRYVEMYGLSPDIAKPGCTFHDLIRHRKESGSLKGDPDTYYRAVGRGQAIDRAVITQTTDGRFIQIANKPLADGGWVATHEDVTERLRSQERITHLAHYDALTELPNRVMFGELIEQEIRWIERGGEFAVLYIDIDEFKSVNDSLGHPVGDELLKIVAQRLRDCLSDQEFVARLGGDEFAIVQKSTQSVDDTTELVERIYAAIRAPFDCLGHEISIDASIGIASAPVDGTTLEELLKNADLAMYSAKKDGRRTYRLFKPEMQTKVQRRRQLELDLRQIIADGSFEESGLAIFYQPLVCLQTGLVTGCEALLRWKHPERGMISPAEFIPVAEETGLISQLGEWVLTTACMEAATWPDHVKIAINVSPVQFKTQTLALKIVSALGASGLTANRLEVEITEAILIQDDDTTLSILHDLRAIGVRIALDDFGTGYSSLSYLQKFPFDKIKIDRCFVKDIGDLDGSSSIIKAVVNIAADRKMTTTAEGVETEQQRDLLKVLGCTEMQGYLFSPARPAKDIHDMLRAPDRDVKADQIVAA